MLAQLFGIDPAQPLMDNFEIYGQLPIDYGQLSMYGQLSIWTIVHDGQLIVHAWTIVHGPLWTIVHTMDNCPLSMSMYTSICRNDIEEWWKTVNLRQ